MATVGSIAVAFEADIKGLESGIEDIIDLFDDLSEAVDSIADKLSGISQRSITLRVDTSGITRATQEIETLRAAAESSQPVVTTRADATEVQGATAAVEDLGTAIDEASGRSVSVDSSQAEQSFSRTSIFAREFARIVSGAVSASLNGIADTFQGVASAARGIDSALVSVSDGFQNVRTSADATIVAVGRTLDAFGSSRGLISAASSAVGGYATVTAAAAGSAAAAATAVSTLAATMVGSAAGTATYAGVMAASRAATAGMSEEAQRYAAEYAGMGANVLAGTAQVAATVATFRIVSQAILSSATFGEFLSRVFTGLGATATAVGSRISGVVNAIGPFLAAFRVFSTATANPNISVPQLELAVARVTATSVALAALGGAVTSLTAGTSVLGGALSSAAASFPPIAVGAIAAAVATGRLAHELEVLSLQAQATEQMASRFGSTTQEMTKLRLAAANTNVSMSQLAKGQQAFYTNLSKIKIGQLNVETVREAKLAYDRLGISIDELKAMKPEEAFRVTAKAISEVKDPADRTRAAFDLFGKQGAAILPALKEFGELEQDFRRLGGALGDLDFDRFTTLENSFDRIKAAGANLGRVLLIPFVELQKAFNNFAADIRGGLAAALTPVASTIADMTKPLAVVIELFGRVLNILLRLAGVVGKVASGFLDFAMIADIIAAIGDAFTYMLSFVEEAISVLEEIADVIYSFLRPSITSLSESITGFGKSIAAAVIGAIASITAFNIAWQSAAVRAVANAAIAYTAIGVTLFGGMLALIPVVVASMAYYAASWIGTAAVAMTAAVQIHAAWLVSLGPVGLLIGGIELVGAAFVGLYATGGELYNLFVGVGKALGVVGDNAVRIDAASASVEELASAAEQNMKGDFQKDMEALSASTAPASGPEAEAAFAGATDSLVQFGMAFGATEEQAKAWAEETGNATRAAQAYISSVAADIAASLAGPPKEEIMASVSSARDKIGEFTIQAAKFGQAGTDAASQTQQEFNKLQQSLADGDITLEDFDSSAAKLATDLQKNLDILANDSPEVTLKKNLELYKQLGDAAKQSGKEMRDAMADVKIGDKFFPRSEEVKAKAQEFQDKYAAALEAIKKKQQSGGFAAEIRERKKQNEDDLEAGRITKDQFEAVKLRLDSTSSQEEAQKAAEDAKRTLENDMSSLDLSFADDIRKQLEDAFKSPVEKFQKELDKVRANKDLTSEEKEQAEKMLRKNAREGLIGKTATEKFDERDRDIKQGAAAGLLNANEATIEAAKNADELAKALGLPVNPANALTVTTLSLKEAHDKAKISAEQLARGMADARRSFLESLGIKEKPGEADQRMLDDLNTQREKGVFAEKIQERVARGELTQEQADSAIERNGGRGISDSELQRGRQAIENNIIGQSASSRIKEQRERIEQGMANGTVDKARGQSAMRGLDRDKKQAAGLDLTAGEQMQAGVDKINEAFSEAERGSAEYKEAIKKNAEAAMASVGVQKPAIQTLTESQRKLDQAVRDEVISTDQAAEASRKLADDFMSAIGVTKTPMEQASRQIEKIAAEFGMANKPIEEVRKSLAGTPEKLALFERALKETRDNLLQSLGVEKTPQQKFEETMKKIDEAAANGGITADDASKARIAATRARNQELGAETANDRAGKFGEQRRKIEEAFGINGEKNKEAFTAAMDNLRKQGPGAEQESPVKKFQESMRELEMMKGSLDKGEFSQRKANLQAQLQEDLKPALDRLKPDRRAVDSGGDARSKSGVDTFFRILRGRDNPGLKAQLDTAKATKEIAEAMKEPDAAPVIMQLQAR